MESREYFWHLENFWNLEIFVTYKIFVQIFWRKNVKVWDILILRKFLTLRNFWHLEIFWHIENFCSKLFWRKNVKVWDILTLKNLFVKFFYEKCLSMRFFTLRNFFLSKIKVCLWSLCNNNHASHTQVSNWSKNE